MRQILSLVGGIAVLLAIFAPAAGAQGSRKDDVVFGPSGHPVAGATIRVCQSGATGTPCAPLATIFTDATLTVPAANPFPSDGIGNYHFYAPAGRYQVQISAPQINGTTTFPDVILPADVSSTGVGNNISAFGLTLGGNLTVAGNASISGTLSTTNFNPTNFTPSSLQVAGNESVQGPRPRVDVTAFGADATFASDSTAAIQAAINAACSTSMTTGGGDIFFPPGSYKVLQPQTPSTAPVFNIPLTCMNLHFIGGNNNHVNIPQFGIAPLTSILALPGASPNAAPVFLLESGQGAATEGGGKGTTFENLAINGFNQAVWIYSGNFDRFVNCALAVQTTGQADNAPLKVTNSFWIWFLGGTLQSIGTSVPVAIFDAEASLNGEQPLVGLLTIRDTISTGGQFVYDQRVGASAQPGNFIFDNVSMEMTGAANQAAFLAKDEVGTTLGPLTFIQMNVSDDLPAPFYETAMLRNTDITMINVQNANASGPAIQVDKFEGHAGVYGQVFNCVIHGGWDPNRTAVNDAGQTVQGCVSTNSSGWDYTGNSATADQRTDTLTTGTGVGPGSIPYGAATAGFAGNEGFPARFTEQGELSARIGIEPVLGLDFGPGGSRSGYDSRFTRSADQTLSLTFALANPPSAVTATVQSGGSLTAGSHSYTVASATSAANCTTTTAAFLPILATASSGNQTVQVNWTPPVITANITGYCVTRDNATQFFVSGATTNSFTDTGTGGTAATSPVFNATFPAAAQFTWSPSGFGVNNSNPQFSLDVNGAAEVNALNGVQMADRFSGADAAAKINACLIAAATSSSVCDARGLTGTLTGSAHISIPAGTTLLWGSAQLTINDSATKDAIEFTGDGAALVGYQESGLGTVPRPDNSGFIACGIAGCTTVDNPNSATRNVDWIHINGMYLLANGASSTVLNLTSIGHSDIENNRFVLGAGGNSFGIFGNTSTGNQDSTNSLIKHNEFDPQSAGDTCLFLAGVFNTTVVEANSCYLPPASSTGFQFAKDTNGNYPNNDEFYGNDCETSSTAFGQVCYFIQGAQSLVVGPNDRCEKVYNCVEFPSDGSAVGIHLLDPYLSISNNTQTKPNEPAAAMSAVDNNGHNWTPSMHYGMNDLAGPNLLGNAGFEGWQNGTTLYYWGGVSGTNINQAGSGIYAQETSAGANPAADSFTQGTFNVRVGDGATAGLGVNSGCIQVDATQEYTLMFRVASAATTNTFRPGFRFFSDANCTEANRITTASSNARVLAAANYAGQSSLVGATGSVANWQSTNASLTYNNGITCNCNVTGADWQVATANSWTPTRNYGITFRVPNAFSSSATVTHSMRVFLLENTAAANNFVYFDDVVLSQGPVTADVVRPRPIPDSGSPAVYGSLAVSQHLNQATANTFAGTIALAAGTATVTFPTPYTSAPVCVANDTSAIATVRVQTTATALTLSQSSGTDTIMYMCVGNPN
jgi:hypothetical protein